MPLRSWLRKRLTNRPQPRRTSRFLPRLEALEARDLPSFSAPVAYPVYGTQALATADVNGDGNPDLVTLFNNGESVGVWLNNGSGTFALNSEAGTGAGPSYTGTALGLSTGAGNQLHAAVADWPGPDNSFGYTDAMTWMAGKASGSFTAVGTVEYPNSSTPLIPDGNPITSLALAPLYGDGTQDIVAGESVGHVYVLHHYSGAQFGPTQTLAMPAVNGPAAVAVGDFNGDGVSDIAVAAGGDVYVFLNNGSGGFGAPQTYAVSGGPTALAVGDVSGDGKLDIVTANANGTASVLVNAGNGTFAAAQSYTIGGPATSVTLGDFNGDGHLDIATTGTELDVLLNNGNGTFGAYQNVGPGGTNVVAADFNGDGQLDLAEIAGSTSQWGSIDVLFNNAGGSLTGGGFPASTTAGAAHGFTVTALNADGTVNTGYTGTVHLTSTDPRAVLPADYTFTAADQGVHVFPVTLETAGTQAISVTATASSALVGSQSGIIVTPAAAATLVFSSVPSSTVAGSAANVTVTAQDAYGNTATGYTGTVGFTSSDGRAVLPANYTFTSSNAGQASFAVTFKTAGTQSLVTSDTVASGLTATASSLLVIPAAPAQLIVSAPASVKSGAKFSVTLTVEDAYGNVETGAGNVIYVTTVHFASSDPSATLPKNYTFSTAGAQVHTFSNGFVLKKQGVQTITVTEPRDAALTTTISIDVL